MSFCVFVTGASGTIGRYLVAELLRKKVSVIAFLQASSKNKRKELLEFLSICGISVKKQQLRFVYGDVTQKDLGLSLSTRKDLALCITHIIHAAADTTFSLSLSKARRINVLGTLHTLEFALSCPMLLTFGYLSTVYVSGKRQGEIKEEDLLDCGFVNAYEQSKFEAEKLIRDYSGRMPINVYRLSTIIGDSQSGYVSHLNSVHKALRLYHSGLAPMIPGIPTNHPDFLSTDYASEVIIYLLLHKFKTSKTYHIVSGSEKSFTLKELLEETRKNFTIYDKNWKKKMIEPPAIVSEETFSLFEQSVKEAGDIVMTRIIQMMQYFIPHLTYTTYFSTENTDKALQGNFNYPHISQYYGKVIKYCVNTNWGQNIHD